MTELWRKVNGFPRYEVSNSGKVRNAETGLVLKPVVCKGYCIVSLSDDTHKQKNLKVHRLVAEAFLPNPNGKATVNHIDENKQNNEVVNLEWATSAEQNAHGTRLKRAAAARCRPVFQYSLNGDFIAEYRSGVEAERKTGVCRRYISNCICGRSVSSNGFIWRHERYEHL